MSGRAYGMLYPTPSPSAEVECRWRAAPMPPHSTGRRSAHVATNAAHGVRTGAGSVTAVAAGRVPPRVR
jgi:hypothetical protein